MFFNWVNSFAAETEISLSIVLPSFNNLKVCTSFTEFHNTMVSPRSKILIIFTVHVPRSIVKTQNMKVKVL